MQFAFVLILYLSVQTNFCICVTIPYLQKMAWCHSFQGTLSWSLCVRSVTQSCPTLCDPMDCSIPGLPVHRHLQNLLKLMSIESEMLSSYLISAVPFSPSLQSFPASGSFQMSQRFTSHGQSIGVSASTSVLPVNIQDWFPLGWTKDLLAVHRTLKSLLQHHSSKASILRR